MTIEQSTFATSGETTPGAFATDVTPANTDLPAFTRALYVGGAGDLEVTMAGQREAGTVTFIGVVAGSLLPLRVSQVNVGTTASSIVAVW